ncbi:MULTISPECIES: hypothetical protein [unclassified Shewanella]|uniref:hypothetical protein n=1 Tax=unclassified Shewanella TaxID=196818 RepID=UPI001BC54852|nr:MULTISPECIES: hypothetical protein [unclassified Shewanella]GIU15814.1 hypothetical protein TUM4444_27650 [Shewanella sp. MBTL60-112-B1]GIU39463.1 hypothetical protein TUM4445_35940 [Shewanella sp. MBTL60-112-B2]
MTDNNLDSKQSDKPSLWLTSKEAMKHLGLSGCELMHKRERGELTFKKQGNAYLYLLTPKGN